MTKEFKKEFKVDFKHQFRSFKECLMILIWTMGGAALVPLVFDGVNTGELLVIAILFWLITSVAMTLPFHIQYLVANWRTKLIVDGEVKTIRIIQGQKTYDYKFSDISVVRHILGHYRPGRQKSWISIPFDYYGYLQIETNDNKEVYLTSLMLDPL